ncbi:MAG: hypothetical protein FJ109_08440 [Deltaproteobacteria bacterium]|nr:hypothetical protein [Deltaproteobacteria bacterium]
MRHGDELRVRGAGLVLALFLVAGSGTVAAAPCSPYGINGHIPSSADLKLIKSAGFDWVRMDFNWFQIEPSKGNFQWGFLDAVVNEAHSLGLNIFPTLSYTPKWASANPNCTPNAPGKTGCNTQTFANVGDWTNFVTKVVSRYKDKIKYWGMWNEPNLEHFYIGSEDDYIQQILIPGAKAAKAADPSCFILGPELAGMRGDAWHEEDGTCILGQCIYNGWEIGLANILDKAGSHIDIITQHFYKDTPAELAESLLEGKFELGFIQVSHSLKEVVEKHGQGQPVWLAEWGWESKAYGGYKGGGDFTEKQQADYLVQFFQIRDQIVAGTYPDSDKDPWPQLTTLLAYDFHDGVVVEENELWSFGLVKVDGTPKPAYDALKAYFLAHPPSCGTPSSKPPQLQPLPDLFLLQGKSLPQALDLSLYATDSDTPAGSLVFSLVKSEPPQAGVGIAEGHFLSVIPQGNWVGTAQVTVQVSDGTSQAADSLAVEVGPAQPPLPLEAPRLEGLVLDGKLSEWGGIPPVPLPAAGHWAGLQGAAPAPADFSASFRVAWMDGVLYAAVEVVDDTHLNGLEPQDMWLGDSVQMALDPSHDGTMSGYGADDWEAGAALLAGAPFAACWQKPQGVPGCPVGAAIVRSGNVTTYEIVLPTALQSVMRFCLLVNENDGKGRDGWLEWTPGIGLGKAPLLFGEVVLVDDVVSPPEPGEDTGPPDVVSAPDLVSSDLPEADSPLPRDDGGLPPGSDSRVEPPVAGEVSNTADALDPDGSNGQWPFPVPDDLGGGKAGGGCSAATNRAGLPSGALLLALFLAGLLVAARNLRAFSCAVVCIGLAAGPSCSETEVVEWSGPPSRGPHFQGAGDAAAGTWDVAYGEGTSARSDGEGAGGNRTAPPGTEQCNGIDDDDDGETDEEGAFGCTKFWIDQDGDGFGVGDPWCLCAPTGKRTALEDGDCADFSADIFPGAIEDCYNSMDDDCDGLNLVPDCDGKECGDDGCGGQCGACEANEYCDANLHCMLACTPSCAGKECGDDGCVGTCGTCLPQHQCFSGKCQCVPDCAGKQCGNDGCGGLCGQCGWGTMCNPGGQCVCQPQCAGKECGNDGCGGQCGDCGPSKGCQNEKCVPLAVVEVYPYCPPGYTQAGRWKTGPTKKSMGVEGAGFSSGSTKDSWMVLCSLDPSLAQVSAAGDDCNDPHPYSGCPDGMANRGPFHVGSCDCKTDWAAYGAANGPMRSGWMVLCTDPAKELRLGIISDDCEWSYPYLGCPSGWTWLGEWHTDPAVCDSNVEAEAKNGKIDSGVVAVCGLK